MLPRGTIVVVDPSKVGTNAVDAVRFVRGRVEFQPEDPNLPLAIEKACQFTPEGELVLRASRLRSLGYARELAEATFEGVRTWMPWSEGRIGKRSLRWW